MYPASQQPFWQACWRSPRFEFCTFASQHGRLQHQKSHRIVLVIAVMWSSCTEPKIIPGIGCSRSAVFSSANTWGSQPRPFARRPCLASSVLALALGFKNGGEQSGAQHASKSPAAPMHYEHDAVCWLVLEVAVVVVFYSLVVPLSWP